MTGPAAVDLRTGGELAPVERVEVLGSGIGRAANLALAGLPGFVQPAGMSPASVLYEDDLVDPTYLMDDEGFVAVPTERGWA